MIGHPPLVSRSFEIPMRVEAEQFVLVPLTAERFHLDYECYMSSVDHLQRTFNVAADPSSLKIRGELWPANSDVEFALIDAAWSQFEWQEMRSSFTYTALTHDMTRQLGCGYIFPSKKKGWAIECQTWVREDMLASGFDSQFRDWFRAWVIDAWNFNPAHVAWPGRDIPWDEWNSMPDQPGRGPIVPSGFDLPMRVEESEFVLVPLTVERFQLDFESYMSSVDHLQRTFDIGAQLQLGGETWPANSDIEFAVTDAAWCQFEWEHMRSSFTYTALNHEMTRQLGCGYIFPSMKPGWSIECQTWVRQDTLASGFDSPFYDWFRTWVTDVWPFDSQQVAWPGREISWNEWNAIPDRAEGVEDVG